MAEDPWRDRRLPESLRDELRRPLGPVVSGADALEAVKSAAKVVTVGDACTVDLIARGRVPDVAVVDFKTKRNSLAREETISFMPAIESVIRAENPAGMLARDAWRAVDEALKSPSRVRIEVQGEEDLVALAAIALAPEGTAVLYGMPDAGVVVVVVDGAAKARVQALLARMV